MTSEAPKEMWLSPSDDDGWLSPYAGCVKEPYTHSYTLTTHALAMVAAEREAIAYEVCDFEQKDAEENDWTDGAWLARRIGSAIRARTPADEKAALDALLRAERVKALREARQLAISHSESETAWALHELIEKETGH